MGELTKIQGVFIGLLVLAVIVSLTFVFGGKLDSVVCTIDDSDNVFDSGTCYTNSSLTTEADVTALDATADIFENITFGITLVTLLILMIFFKPILNMIKGFAKGM